LAFESYDAIGRYREREGDAVLDTSGEIAGATDPALAGKFADVRELAEKLAASQEVRECLARQWFRFASGRTEVGVDVCSVEGLAAAFATGDVRELIVASTLTDAFWFRSPIAP
jgi:hypothetical protein